MSIAVKPGSRELDKEWVSDTRSPHRRKHTTGECQRSWLCNLHTSSDFPKQYLFSFITFSALNLGFFLCLPLKCHFNSDQFAATIFLKRVFAKGEEVFAEDEERTQDSALRK